MLLLCFVDCLSQMINHVKFVCNFNILTLVNLFIGILWSWEISEDCSLKNEKHFLISTNSKKLYSSTQKENIVWIFCKLFGFVIKYSKDIFL